MEENEDIISRLEAERITLQSQNQQLNTALSSSTYSNQEGGNLIEYQLDTSELLSYIEHFLKGDYIDTDKKNNQYWAKQTNPEMILFNEYGVNSIMHIIGNYINRNTILSKYDEDRINEILADLGDELRKFIYCNYDKMGMDTDFKKSRYGVVVITILNAIESSYRRALGGKTSEDINTSKIFTQLDTLGNRAQSQQNQRKKFNLFNPKTW